jgi:hypothetical protein
VRLENDKDLLMVKVLAGGLSESYGSLGAFTAGFGLFIG